MYVSKDYFPGPYTQRMRSQLRLEAIERATQWKSLIGTDGIETRANLSRYFGISRARVTHVLKRLANCSFNNHLHKKIKKS